MEKLAFLMPPSNEDRVLTQVEKELETIFGTSGVQVVVDFARKYEVTLRDAVRRPSAFQIALYYLLGEFGSNLVMARINNIVTRVDVSASPTTAYH